MKIYTKSGDQGETGLFGGPRVPKDHARIETYGSVDELNAILGIARTCELPPDIDTLLADVQNGLFDLGAELATPDAAQRGMNRVDQKQIDRLEKAIDQYETELKPLKCFILPGGSALAAHLHHARTVCRRAERRMVTLARQPGEAVSQCLLVYLNRLGDLLFVLARAANARRGRADIPWQQSDG